MDYETIDLICDSTNPVLFLWAVALIVFSIYKKYRKRTSAIIYFVFGLISVYGLQYVDSRFGLWSTYQLDYSTHSAFALVMATTIASILTRAWVPFIVFAIYESLVLYQKYHSVLDVITTLIVVAFLLFFLRVISSKLTKDKKDALSH